MLTAKQLTKIVQELEGFTNPNARLEQYITPPRFAAELLIEHAEHINGKTVLDLGAGTGILGIGALLMGATTVVFVEKDNDAIIVLERNLAKVTEEYLLKGTYTIIPEALALTDEHADTTIMNPPFGTRNEHADTAFLDYALMHSKTVITMHKTSTCNHIRYHVKRLGKTITHEKNIHFPLKHTMQHHTKPEEKIAVTVFTIK